MIVATCLGLGYLVGKQRVWQPFLTEEEYRTRFTQLKYTKAVIPLGLFEHVKEGSQVFTEAVSSFLFGSPNASVPMTIRCLEMGLKTKYKEVQNQEPPQKLADCIDWSEKYLGRKKELAHGFRILRNLVHEDVLVQEPDALEAIRHVTLILNQLHPFNGASYARKCPECSTENTYDISANRLFLGNSIELTCPNPKCNKSDSITIHPTTRFPNIN